MAADRRRRVARAQSGTRRLPREGRNSEFGIRNSEFETTRSRSEALGTVTLIARTTRHEGTKATKEHEQGIQKDQPQNSPSSQRRATGPRSGRAKRKTARSQNGCPSIAVL